MENINPADVMMFYVPFLFALCFHEWAHGFVAKLRGDNTAELMGRLTFNPLAHMDFIGTLVFPILGFISQSFLFGWAKPVPVNPRNLKDPKNDMFWVALAGPASNIFLALVGALVFAVIVRMELSKDLVVPLSRMLFTFIQLNFILAFFNLIPIHPLDGGKILGRFLPANINRAMEQHQGVIMIAVMAGLFLGGSYYLSLPVRKLTALLISLAA